MAIATYLEYGDIRGSIGGKVYSRNRYGPYIRNRTKPINPNSSRQQAARNNFSDIAEHWSALLTDAERTAWNLYGASVPVTNRLGFQIYLSGFNHFLRSNTAIKQVAGTVVEAGPTIFTLPESDGSFACTISEATQLISVAFDTNKAWVSEDDAYMYIYMMQPRGQSRSYLVGPCRFADSIDGDSGTPPTSPQTIAVPFAVAEDQNVIVEARIGRADGRLSDLFQDTVSVAS
jgi:hypothetical protein